MGFDKIRLHSPISQRSGSHVGKTRLWELRLLEKKTTVLTQLHDHAKRLKAIVREIIYPSYPTYRDLLLAAPYEADLLPHSPFGVDTTHATERGLLLVKEARCRHLTKIGGLSKRGCHEKGVPNELTNKSQLDLVQSS